MLVVYYAFMLFGTIASINGEGGLEDGAAIEELTGKDALFYDHFSQTDRTHLELVVRHEGYDGESHSPTTEDGFKILLHRIKSRGSGTHQNEPIMLIHGIISNAGQWLALRPEYNLAYKLSDLGYDVWLFNERGKSLTNGHITIQPDDSKYWNWGQDEIGFYDMPTAINYILNVTSMKQLSLVGHSLGCAYSLIALTERPELNSKVRTVIFLAPEIAATIDGKGIFWRTVRTVALLAKENKLEDFTNRQLLISINSEKFSLRNCSEPGHGRRACPLPSAVEGDSTVYNADENGATLYRFYCMAIGSTSRKNILHIGQASESGNFTKFDYGEEKNLELYKSDKPPFYDLSKLNVPIHMFYATGDKAIRRKDVMPYCERLTGLGKDVHCSEVMDPKFGHGDFLLNHKAMKSVYEKIIAILNK